MIELFVKRPAMTIMLVLVFVVLGFVSYFNITIESAPKIKFPMVTVRAVYPGAGPLEIETQLIKKIEDAVAEISQIKKINSQANENFGFVFIEFDLSSDVNIKASEVKDKVEQIVNEFPDGAEKPITSKFDPLIQPVVELIASSDNLNDRDLYEYVDKKLKNSFNAIEGVASVNLYGGKKRQINIRIDQTLMKRYYASLSDIITAIAMKNANIPGGSINKSGKEISVRMIGEFASVNEIASMKIVSQEGNIFRLSDLATVEDTFRKVESEARYDGKNVVGLSIMKLSDGDAVKISRNINKKLPEIQKSLPEGMKLQVAHDSTEQIISETRDTILNIIFGVILTAIILFLFTGNLRYTFIAAIVIPTSIISSFLLMDFSEFTINFATLLAFATALGTLIANAIVIIESVSKYVDQGMEPKDAAVKGTKDVVIAIIASAGTNLVVFTPIGFMGGIVGQFMRQFGLTVVYATVFSIIASFSLTPMLCGVMLKKKEKKQKDDRTIGTRWVPVLLDPN